MKVITNIYEIPDEVLLDIKLMVFGAVEFSKLSKMGDLETILYKNKELREEIFDYIDSLSTLNIILDPRYEKRIKNQLSLYITEIKKETIEFVSK